MLISLSTKLTYKDTEIVKFTKLIKSCLINLNYTLLIDLGQITHHNNREADKTNLEKNLLVYPLAERNSLVANK